MKILKIDVKDNSDQVLNELINKEDAILEAIGVHIEGEAKEELENTPRRIDTGLLRNSITHAISGESPAIKTYHGDKESKYSTKQAVPVGRYNGNAPNDPENKKAVYIGSNVKYASFIHEGFRLPSGKPVAPNRFLKNACTRNEEWIKKYIKDKLSEN